MPRKPLTSELRERAKAFLSWRLPNGVLKNLQGRLDSLLGADQLFSKEETKAAIIAETISKYRGDETESTTYRDLIHRSLDFEPTWQVIEYIDEIEKKMAVELDNFFDDMVTRGERFLAAAEDANVKQLEALSERGAPLNYHDPRNGATALHYVAAQGARRALRFLLKTEGIDFLARDNQGRLASEIAGTYGQDLAMERLLANKEIRQARASGVPLEDLYRRDRRPGPAPSPAS
jgi:hypothetical protein